MGASRVPMDEEEVEIDKVGVVEDAVVNAAAEAEEAREWMNEGGGLGVDGATAERD